MVTHDNLVYTATACMMHTSSLGKGGQERLISYLPLSHVAGMMVDICCPLSIGSRPEGYVTTYFARPYDLKVASIGDRLRIVKPTIFLGVPRVWEKLAEKMKAVGAKTTGLKKKIATFRFRLDPRNSRNSCISHLSVSCLKRARIPHLTKHMTPTPPLPTSKQ